MWACFMIARVHTPSSQVRERERERERGRERVSERERCRICPEFLFLKGMTGTLPSLNYLLSKEYRLLKFYVPAANNSPKETNMAGVRAIDQHILLMSMGLLLKNILQNTFKLN